MAIYSAVPPPPDLASAGTASATTTAQQQQQGPSTPQHHDQQQQSQPPYPHHGHTQSGSLDIEAWTVSALEALSVSPIARGTGTPLSINIDQHHHHHRHKKTRKNGDDGEEVVQTTTMTTSAGRVALAIDPDHPAAGMTPPRRPPSRRDSQRKRDMLLKGKEGSRQRRRWENGAASPHPHTSLSPFLSLSPSIHTFFDSQVKLTPLLRRSCAQDRLMHVPNAQPPLPTDWHVRPTHPVRNHLPYHVAAHWEQRGLRQRAEEDRAAAAARRKRAAGIVPGHAAEAGRVPRDLRATAKKTPAVRAWVRVLEEPVRRLLEESNAAAAAAAAAAAEAESKKKKRDEASSDDEEEIVFSGRKSKKAVAAVAAAGVKRAHREVRDRPVDQGMVFDALGDDETSAFKRWLTHSISDYYGLVSRSATVGSPPRRVVYVTIKDVRSSGAARARADLPPPMWELM
ncbi:uncharacterized protein E0L32_000535 [Thyridium curvatum]|uniref:R3H domain-containing protein n=1 Tax=Thyridium curvatum TaxID=1093900 RepID=A0A507BAN4_9PEZI|nr:uncharacterized protein E0L32_000535 [Thyridium curvatum]TPX14141.1 hypothetical protein E0L32_000535 [Thyridium curvatum]